MQLLSVPKMIIHQGNSRAVNHCEGWFNFIRIAVGLFSITSGLGNNNSLSSLPLSIILSFESAFNILSCVWIDLINCWLCKQTRMTHQFVVEKILKCCGAISQREREHVGSRSMKNEWLIRTVSPDNEFERSFRFRVATPPTTHKFNLFVLLVQSVMKLCYNTGLPLANYVLSICVYMWL